MAPKGWMSLVEGGLFHAMKSMPHATSASQCCSSLMTSPAQKKTSFTNTKRSAGHAGMLRSGICRSRACMKATADDSIANV